MVDVKLHPAFEKAFCRIKDAAVEERVLKQLERIRNNPELGKPMRFERKGTREVYIPPFRLAYAWLPEENLIIIIDLYHKDKQ